MAKALSSRRGRGRKAADAWADGGGEERQQQHNAKARQDTIRMVVRELSRMEAERKAISAEIAEFKATHIKGDLGFKIADFNAIVRIYNLETEDRDQLLDTLREGFEALSIGGTLDWVAAERGEAQPPMANGGAAAPGRRRGAKAPEGDPVVNPDAFQMGKADGLAGHRDHAARYPEGEIAANAYQLGHAAGQRERHGPEGNGADPEPAAAPKRGRGRPRKPAEQPGLSIVEGAGTAA
jgi:uncharacterized protein (UPF0335 family)